ncbi:MAG: F-box protein, partial [Candidatus Thermoplasmatota archaeon]|nr:F-box protein [Candidatus Thermoplasmatota archaeon]
DADVVGHILSFLSFQDIVKFGGVCKHTASIVDSLPHDLNLRKQKGEFPVVSSVFPHLFTLDATTTQRSDYKALERLMDVPSVVPRTTSDPKTTGEWTFVIFDGFEDRPLLIRRSTPEFSNVKDSIDSDGWMMVEGSASLDADVRELLGASNTPRMVILVGTRCVFDGESMYTGEEDCLQFSEGRAGVFSDDEWIQLALFQNRIDLTFNYLVVNAKFVTTFASKIARNTHGSLLEMDGYEILETHETFLSKMNRVTVCERVYQLCRDNCGFVRECLVAKFWDDSRRMCLYDGPPTLEDPIKEVSSDGRVMEHRPGHAMKFPPALDKFLRAKSLSMYGVDHV